MKNKSKSLIFSALLLLLAMGFIFRAPINDILGCLAYWKQCTAARVEGLTSEQCLARDDDVAYLIDEKICLVKKK